MSRREDIDNAIWQDPDFDLLSNHGALLYLWSFTNPRCGMAGIYKVARRQILESRLSDAELTEALAELERLDFIQYRDGVLWVRSRVRHLRTKGELMARSVFSDLEKIETTHDLLAAFTKENEGGWLGAFSKGPRRVPEKRSDKPKSNTHSGPIDGSQGKGTGKGTGNRDTTGNEGEGPIRLPSVARRQVTADEWRLCGEIIAAFNQVAKARFTRDAHFKPIIGRIREHPDLALAEHRATIAAAFVAPWWTGAPGPEVVYGNRAQFERSLAQRDQGNQGSEPEDEFAEKYRHVTVGSPEYEPYGRFAEEATA